MEAQEYDMVQFAEDKAVKNAAAKAQSLAKRRGDVERARQECLDRIDQLGAKAQDALVAGNVAAEEKALAQLEVERGKAGNAYNVTKRMDAELAQANAELAEAQRLAAVEHFKAQRKEFTEMGAELVNHARACVELGERMSKISDHLAAVRTTWRLAGAPGTSFVEAQWLVRNPDLDRFRLEVEEAAKAWGLKV